MWGEPRNEVKTRKRGEMMKWNEGEGVARKDLKGGKAAGERGGGREGWFRGGEGGDGRECQSAWHPWRVAVRKKFLVRHS